MPLLFSLLFNNLSAWWLLPCLIFGFGLAWLLYQKSNLDQRNLKLLLFSLRGLLISTLAFLLLSPLLKYVQSRLEKPLIIIAQDASASILFGAAKGFDSVKYHQDLNNLQSALAKNYDVEILNFGDAVNSGFNFKQTEKATNFTNLFSYIKNQFPDRNIGSLVFASDGIYNRGDNQLETSGKSKYPIYSIALGDTIAKKDIVVEPINYNNLVYLGNNYEVEIPISAFKAKNNNTVLRISTSDGQSKSQSINFNNDNFRKSYKIVLEAKKKGLQKIVVEATAIQNELSVKNNKQIIYVDVIDSKEKILMLANAPHPDISAIKQAIETKQNYEVKLAFADDLPASISDYGLIIFHNLPSINNALSQLSAQAEQKSRWYIIGEETNLGILNQQQNLINAGNANGSQEYTASFNPIFTSFTLTEEARNSLSNLAPLIAPFATYGLKSEANNLFNAQIGNVKTNAPLLTFSNNNGIKTAALIGEGIWRWRLEDFEKNENHAAFDELITSTVQYLSAKDDKRKFRVYPIKNRFAESENILFSAELYDDAYNPNNEPDVSLDIRGKLGNKYSFLMSRVGSSYQLNAGFLPADEYTFEAKTSLGKANFKQDGQFLVEEINIELLQTTANHQLLFNMANLSGGQMVYPVQIKSLEDLLTKNEKIKTLSYEEKSYESLINLKWIFFLLILILSLEWFLRKRNGAI
jgi:hypothetical protein